MKTPFRLDEHPRRRPQPLSSPPAGYFEQLPTRIMAQVAAPARQPRPLAWLPRCCWARLRLRCGWAAPR
jgi:hypothetical protein